MVIYTKKEFLKYVNEDEYMMEILRTVKSLNLPDWWVCAGFVRSKIWDLQHGFEVRTMLPDVDVIYFNSESVDENKDKVLEEILNDKMANVPWSVKNQARMHTVNRTKPYTSSVDAISNFPETATSLGLKLDQEGKLILAAPHGLEDALHMKVRPTPFFMNKKMIGKYNERVGRKNWQSKWPMVEIFSGKGNLDEKVENN